MDDNFGFWDVIVSMFWFMLLFAWIWLFIVILRDLFADRELGGGAKALWVVVLVLFPWIGALVYLIARGSGMHERALKGASEQEAQFRAYVQEAAGSSGSVADELRKLAELRDAGTLSNEEYERAKSQVLT